MANGYRILVHYQERFGVFNLSHGIIFGDLWKGFHKGIISVDGKLTLTKGYILLLEVGFESPLRGSQLP